MKRRPKGMGTVTDLGSNRRKPYLASINKKIVGTYSSKIEAEKALLRQVLTSLDKLPLFISEKYIDEYITFLYDMQQNRLLPDSVLDFPKMDMINEMFKNQLIAKGFTVEIKDGGELIEVPTFAEIWNIEFERLKGDRSKSWDSSMTAAFKSLNDLHDMKISQIRTSELQNAFDRRMALSKCGKSTLNNMIIVSGIVFDYAIKLDYIEKNYTKYINFSPTSKPRNNRTPFTVEEIKALINDNTMESKIILLYIFTGARPIELLEMKKTNIHLDDHYMVGGVKTEAGKERIIPIHNLIYPYIKELVNKSGNTLINLKYREYSKLFISTMERLNLSNHKESYDTRYTFSTLAKINHLDTSAHKKIMGHSCQDLTDDVYTHEPVKYLLDEVNKITIN